MTPGQLLRIKIDKYSFNRYFFPLDFSTIPPGKFMMGSPYSDPEASPFEQPRRLVTITESFDMLRTPVTQGLWQIVMGNNPADKVGELLPVTNVSWYEAIDFCNRLSRLIKAEEVYDTNGTYVKQRQGVWGVRLPTEAQWEYACRAGTTTPRYGDIDEIAWYSGNSGGTTHSVGRKTPNAWNLYDMLGNVWEWNWDFWGLYPDGTQTNPQGVESGSHRVVRGGSWSHDASNARSGRRSHFTPGDRYYDIGFRICLS